MSSTDGSTRLRQRVPTIADVAREAGVSRAAVSKVLRDAYGVSDQMRERVESAIEHLEYRPRVAARSMRGASYTIGLEIPQITNDFLTMVVHGALEALHETSYRLMVAPVRSLADSGRAIQSLTDRQVDALITVSPLVSQEQLERISQHTPTVVIGRHDYSSQFDTVAGADATGANLMMDHLFSLGHRRIALLQPRVPQTPTPELPEGWAPTGRDPHDIRKRVYMDRMRQEGLLPLVLETGTEELEARSAWLQFLDSSEQPTAVFAGNDTLAIGVLRANLERGIGPSDISVAGYDDTTIASHPALSLTSVDQSGHRMGQEAVRLLLERLGGRQESVQIEEQVTLRIRGSTSIPRDA